MPGNVDSIAPPRRHRRSMWSRGNAAERACALGRPKSRQCTPTLIIRRVQTFCGLPSVEHIEGVAQVGEEVVTLAETWGRS